MQLVLNLANHHGSPPPPKPNDHSMHTPGAYLLAIVGFLGIFLFGKL